MIDYEHYLDIGELRMVLILLLLFILVVVLLIAWICGTIG